jgi:gamma-glutamylcyclotransferase (GGCT)/AIG2-like uncharacterized protein YtfP
VSDARDFAEDERLAVYGSLRPGGSNADVLAPLSGIWVIGTVRGELVQEGWASPEGYPAIRLSPSGPTVAVHVLCSHDLPQHWERLDRFEGPQYRRSRVTVEFSAGALPAQIYEIAD